MTLQEIIFALERFWSERGCLIHQPWDAEVGAGTMHPETFFRVLGPHPWRVGYVQPSRRPGDGRYGENPNRLYKHEQFQVILKPPPANIQDLYLASLTAIGIDPSEHDVRFEEDNWESPTLGAWGIGWQVLLDGQEITQFTYFQQAGGIDLAPISGEITYGLERIAMYLQDVEDVYRLRWSTDTRYRDVRHEEEFQLSRYSFELADVDLHRRIFESALAEGLRLLETPGGRAYLPAYDWALKSSHAFNVLDARGAISVSERAGMILKIRKLACAVAKAYVDAVAPPAAGGGEPGVAELLLEIGFEEMPAPWLPGLAEQLRTRFVEAAGREFLEAKELRLPAHPAPPGPAGRRAGAPARPRGARVGPGAQGGEGRGGELDGAAQGFAKKSGVLVEDLREGAKDQAKPGEIHLLLVRKVAGRPTPEVLPGLLAAVLRALAFPKRMSWDAWLDDGRGAFPFGRPIRWLVFLLDGEVVPFPIHACEGGAKGARHRGERGG